MNCSTPSAQTHEVWGAVCGIIKRSTMKTLLKKNFFKNKI